MKFAAVILISLLLIGCTSTQTIRSLSSPQTESLEKKSTGNTFTILTKDDQKFKAQNIRVINDSITYVDMQLEKKQIMHRNEIKNISRKKYGTGFWQGFFIATGGTVAGSLLASNDPGTGFISARAGMILISPFIGLGGGIVGGIVGATDNFEIKIIERER